MPVDRRSPLSPAAGPSRADAPLTWRKSERERHRPPAPLVEACGSPPLYTEGTSQKVPALSLHSFCDCRKTIEQCCCCKERTKITSQNISSTQQCSKCTGTRAPLERISRPPVETARSKPSAGLGEPAEPERQG